MRNACGLIAESSPSLISGFNHNQFNNPQNFRDEIMENLQKLIDSHQKAELDSQQPGCSSSIFNGTSNNLSNGSLVNKNNFAANFTSNLSFSSLDPSSSNSTVLKSTIVAGLIFLFFFELDFRGEIPGVLRGEKKMPGPIFQDFCVGVFT
ncbi:unnamed protein product [Meloidogyne enterolobii]|uniref:Uncharacterized protein n=1 Tax=Meloidogyne enterolobii TaxID=390850 RepID=A0ACB1ASQ8_MELEN